MRHIYKLNDRRLLSIHPTQSVAYVPGTALVLGVQQWTNKDPHPLPYGIYIAGCENRKYAVIKTGCIIISAIGKNEAGRGVGRGREVLFYRRWLRKAPLIRWQLSRHLSWQPCWGKGVPGGGQNESGGLEEGALLVGLRHRKSQAGWRTEQKGTKPKTRSFEGQWHFLRRRWEPMKGCEQRHDMIWCMS